MQITKVFVIVKPTQVETMGTEEADEHTRMLAAGDADAKLVQSAHDEQVVTLGVVRTELAARGIAYVEAPRDTWDGKYPNDTSLALPVGGDGTVLTSARTLPLHVPMLAVNSSPSTSVGHFCLATAANFGAIIDEIIADIRKPLSIGRLVGYLTKPGSSVEEVLPPVLNEVCIADKLPLVGGARYEVTVPSDTERQLSSGFIVGTPPGSTGMLRSFGGDVLPITERRVQYVSVGPFSKIGQTVRLVKGVLAEGEEIVIVSRMRSGRIFSDVSINSCEFPRGSKLRLTIPKGHDLLMFVDEGANTPYVK